MEAHRKSQQLPMRTRGKVGSGALPRATRKLIGEKALSVTLMVVMVSWVEKYIKIYPSCTF